MRAYPRDPYWLQTKFNSNCSRCKATIRKGARAYYYPNSKSILCDSDDCGGDAARQFESMRFDESVS